MNTSPSGVCPYCAQVLSVLPKKKARCPFCKKEIYVISKQELFQNILLTEEQARVIDWFNRLSVYGFIPEDYFRKEQELLEKFKRTPPLADIIWGLFNEAVVLKHNDYHVLSMIYFQMAEFLDEEGKDPYPCLQDHIKMQLLHYKQNGAKKVKIISITDRITCSFCTELDGKIYLIDDALKKLPIPPKGYPFCRCRYVGAVY